MSEVETSIPKGSWVLVTGVTGYVGSQVAKLFLERGYKVRGTVRNLEKASWVVSDVFKAYADNGSFEMALVPDMSVENAFEESIRGVSAVAHVASVTTFDPEPQKVIPETVQGVRYLLETALRESSVREFVYTSSIVAVTMQLVGNDTHVEQDTWNDDVIPLAWSNDRADNHGSIVYTASKVEAEKALWRFVEERKPQFTVNSVCPSSIMGEPLHKHHVESVAAWMKLLYDGKVDRLKAFGATFNSDVKDVALLHVAAALDPEVKNTRIMSWGYKCNWNDILAIMRRLYPEHKFVDDFPGMSKLSITSDLTLPLALLKKWAGQDGWRSLEETVRDDVDTFVAWENK